MKLLFILALSIFATNASIINRKNNVTGRIIGGTSARSSQFPFAAAIYATSQTHTLFCGGTIINNQYIMTAAHCIENAVLFHIQLGSNLLEGNDSHRVILASGSFVTHPDYNKNTLENDIGIIKLRMPITFNTYISKIELPTAPLEDSAPVTTIGWGQISDTTPGLSNVLQYVQISTISNDECKLSYGNQIYEKMTCVVGQLNEGICTNDSGGALIVYQNEGRIAVQAAIASFVSTNGCETSEPNGYTRVFPYVDWIKQEAEL